MSAFTLVIGNRNWSSWSLRSWLLMKQAGIPFAEAHIRLRQADTRSQALQHSPSGKVPVLKYDGRTVWDSLAIAETLAERFPEKHLWPMDIDARAQARSISAEMHSGFQALRMNLPMDVLGRYPGKGLESEDVQGDIARIQEIWRTCRTQFGAGGDFLFGAFSIADAMYAPVVSRFITYEVSGDAACNAYLQAVWNLPAMQEWRAGCEAI